MSYLVERLFNEDIREKRIIGSGIHSRTGKRGYVGRMIMPYEIMSRKDKYNHRKAGKVVVSNLYDEINVTGEELFNGHSKEQQIKLLTEWRKRFSNKDIATKLGIKESKLSYYLKKYDLIDKEKSVRTSQAKRKGAAQTNQNEVAPIQPSQYINPTPIVIPKQDGIQFAFTGKFASDKIISKLEKIMLLLQDEENDFDVKIFLQEVETDKTKDADQLQLTL